jgi:Putative DNA-binding domain
MQADMAEVEPAFSVGLLKPEAPVPSGVAGSGRRRYGVYRNNVTLGLVRAMEANFPAVRRLLGETYFAGLAREFVQSHPPTHPLLFLYGEHFPAHLEANADLRNFPYLADVARIEMQWRISYHEADAGILSPIAFSAFGESEIANLRFVAHPAFALFRSAFAAHSIFTASRSVADGPVHDPAAAETVLFTRPNLVVQTRVVSPADAAFLSALASGLTLGEAAEQGAASNADFDLTASIALMLQSGALHAIDLERQP